MVGVGRPSVGQRRVPEEWRMMTNGREEGGREIVGWTGWKEGGREEVLVNQALIGSLATISIVCILSLFNNFPLPAYCDKLTVNYLHTAIN